MVNFFVLYLYLDHSRSAGIYQFESYCNIVLNICISLSLCNVYRPDPFKLSFNFIPPVSQTTDLFKICLHHELKNNALYIFYEIFVKY